MNLFIYTPSEGDCSRRLMDIAVDCTGVETKEIFHSFESLEIRLGRPILDETIVVMHITSKKQLLQALSIKEYLHSMKLILILPDTDSHTVLIGHKLYPRFVSYTNSDFSDVRAVLKKVVDNTPNGDAAV